MFRSGDVAPTRPIVAIAGLAHAARSSRPLPIDDIFALYAIELDRSLRAVRHSFASTSAPDRGVGLSPSRYMLSTARHALEFPSPSRSAADQRSCAAPPCGSDQFGSLAQRAPGATASATFPATDPVARPMSCAEALATASAARVTWTRAGVSSAAIAISIMPLSRGRHCERWWPDSSSAQHGLPSPPLPRRRKVLDRRHRRIRPQGSAGYRAAIPACAWAAPRPARALPTSGHLLPAVRPAALPSSAKSWSATFCDPPCSARDRSRHQPHRLRARHDGLPRPQR